MDSATTAESRIILVAGGRRVALRTLTEVNLDRMWGNTWQVPVLAPADALDLGEGYIEVVTPAGLAKLPARVTRHRDQLMLVAISEPVFVQRRNDVRGVVRFQVRLRNSVGGDAYDPGPGPVPGHTVDVSAGGIHVVVNHPAPAIRLPGTRLYAELDLPDHGLVTARLRVVAPTTLGLRAAFATIEPRDRERLVRLVFEAERARLAKRNL